MVKKIAVSIICLIGSIGPIKSQDIAPSVYSLDIDLTLLLNKSHAERTLMLTPFYDWGIRRLDSITIFSKIDKIGIIAKKHNDHALGLEAQLMDLHYYYYRNYFSEILIVSKIKRLKKLAEDEKILWLEIRTLSMLANYYFFELKEYEIGFEYYERTTYLLKNLTPENFPLKSACLYQVGYAHYYFSEYYLALNYFRQSIKFYIKVANDFSYIHSLNNIGLCFKNINQIDSSNYYFDQLNQYAQSTDNRIWQAISLGNKGYNYFLQGNDESAIPLLEFECKVAIEFKDWRLAGESLMNLAEVWYSQRRFDEAERLVLKAKKFVELSDNYTSRTKLYSLLAKMAAYNSNPDRVSLYLDSAFKAKDSLSRVATGLKVLRVKQKTLREQQKHAIEVTLQEQQNQLWIKNVIILLLVFLIVIGFLFYKQFRLKSKNRELLILSQKDAANSVMEQFKATIIKKNKQIESFKQKSNNGTHEVAQLTLNQDEQKFIINQLIETSLLTEEAWQKFVTVFEKIHTGFLDRLNEKWTFLTPSETRIIVLSRLEVDHKKMAIMLGIGANAINQIKSRLRKKLASNKEESFETLISNI